MTDKRWKYEDIDPTYPVSAIPSKSPKPRVTSAKNGGTLRKGNQFLTYR